MTEKQRVQREDCGQLPVLDPAGLRACQVNAIEKLEDSFKDDRPRALIQMATGSGKTYTAITSIYRLLKHADAKRILSWWTPGTWAVADGVNVGNEIYVIDTERTRHGGQLRADQQIEKRERLTRRRCWTV